MTQTVQIECMKDLIEAIGESSGGSIPTPSASDQGKFLGVNKSNTNITWKDIDQVPDTTGASQGDVLTVGSDGYEWSTPTGSIPAYTADNYGQSLMVMPSSGSASAVPRVVWKDNLSKMAIKHANKKVTSTDEVISFDQSIYGYDMLFATIFNVSSGSKGDKCITVPIHLIGVYSSGTPNTIIIPKFDNSMGEDIQVQITTYTQNDNTSLTFKGQATGDGYYVSKLVAYRYNYARQ